MFMQRKKFEWSMFTFLVPIILAVIGWGISVEVRMSKSDVLIDAKVAKMDSALDFSERVKHIEDMLLPLLVDWKVNQELKKLQSKPMAAVPDKVREDAKQWAELEIKKMHTER